MAPEDFKTSSDVMGPPVGCPMEDVNVFAPLFAPCTPSPRKKKNPGGGDASGNDARVSVCGLLSGHLPVVGSEKFSERLCCEDDAPLPAGRGVRVHEAGLEGGQGLAGLVGFGQPATMVVEQDDHHQSVDADMVDDDEQLHEGYLALVTAVDVAENPSTNQNETRHEGGFLGQGLAICNDTQDAMEDFSHNFPHQTHLRVIYALRGGVAGTNTDSQQYVEDVLEIFEVAGAVYFYKQNSQHSLSEARQQHKCELMTDSRKDFVTAFLVSFHEVMVSSGRRLCVVSNFTDYYHFPYLPVCHTTSPMPQDALFTNTNTNNSFGGNAKRHADDRKHDDGGDVDEEQKQSKHGETKEEGEKTKQAKRRKLIDSDGKVNWQELAACFDMPMSKASEKLGYCETILKRLCRVYGLDRWPHRKIKSLEASLAKAQKKVADYRKGENVKCSPGSAAQYVVMIEAEIGKLQRELEEVRTPQNPICMPDAFKPLEIPSQRHSLSGEAAPAA